MSSKRLLLPVMAALMLAGCRSSRHAATTGDTAATPTAPPPVETVTQPAKENAAPALAPLKYVTGKLDFTARKNGQKSVSVGGSIKMGRDEIIQISLVYFIVEVGRLEITPDYILIQDKVNMRYIRKAWADLPPTDGVSYETVQQFFWGEYPMQGQKSLTIPLGSNLSMALTYSEWTEVEGRRFPQKMQLTILSGRQTFAGIFEYSRLKAPSKLGNIATRVGSEYREVGISELIDMLSGKKQ